MAQFDESKVINALHTDKAEIGKKYWRSDSLKLLKRFVEENNSECIGELTSIDEGENFCFCIDDKQYWEIIYPYEETKQRMTNRQLAEWCAKGNGQWINPSTLNVASTVYSYEYISNDDEEVNKNIVIRPFGESEWIEPTVDIYERDCKKE